jgi:hypothetical protein
MTHWNRKGRLLRANRVRTTITSLLEKTPGGLEVGQGTKEPFHRILARGLNMSQVLVRLEIDSLIETEVIDAKRVIAGKNVGALTGIRLHRAA